MSELVKRLRDAGKNLVVVGHTKRALCAEAAARIEALEAENARLRKALDEIASWGEGATVKPSFDEPASAQIARDALAALKDHP